MSKKYKVILIGWVSSTKEYTMYPKRKRTLDEVWIGLNNDSWLRRKKGKSFMKEQEELS